MGRRYCCSGAQSRRLLQTDLRRSTLTGERQQSTKAVTAGPNEPTAGLPPRPVSWNSWARRPARLRLPNVRVSPHPTSALDPRRRLPHAHGVWHSVCDSINAMLMNVSTAQPSAKCHKESHGKGRADLPPPPVSAKTGAILGTSAERVPR